MFLQRLKSMDVLLFIALSVCFTLSMADKKANKPPTYTAEEHKTLLIPCNATEHDDIKLYWTKNTTKSNFYQAGPNLMFVDISRFDSGDYICHAFNTSLPRDNETESNVTVEVVNVDVQYPDEIDGFTLFPYEIYENGTFSITFNMLGNPGPNWEIRNNDTGVGVTRVTGIAANGSLDDISVRCEGYTGNWVITGYNRLNHGVNVTRSKSLTVLCPPQEKPGTRYEQQVLSRVGSIAILHISAVGYPVPEYRWSRAGSQQLPNNWVQSSNGTSFDLEMIDLKPEDFTTYALTLHNKIGTYIATFELKAHGNPEMAYNVSYTDVTSNSVTLSWKSGFDMGSAEHFLVMKLIGNTFIQISNPIYMQYYNHGIDQDWTYTLTSLDSDTEYNLTVMAENADGFLSPLARNHVHFRTKPNPYTPPSNTLAQSTKILLGSIFGCLGFIGLMAFLVYMVKYRNMRTSYVVMKGETKA